MKEDYGGPSGICRIWPAAKNPDQGEGAEIVQGGGKKEKIFRKLQKREGKEESRWGRVPGVKFTLTGEEGQEGRDTPKTAIIPAWPNRGPWKNLKNLVTSCGPKREIAASATNK